MIALSAAWMVSAVALAVNQLAHDGSGIGPGSTIGIIALAIQAIAIVLVGRGSTIARAVALIFLVLAALTLEMLGRLVTNGSLWSASYLALGFALKAIAVYLLFTGHSRKWFVRHSY